MLASSRQSCYTSSMNEGASMYAGPPPPDPDGWTKPVITPLKLPVVIPHPAEDFKEAVAILLRLSSDDRARLRTIIDAMDKR